MPIVPSEARARMAAHASNVPVPTAAQRAAAPQGFPQPPSAGGAGPSAFAPQVGAPAAPPYPGAAAGAPGAPSGPAQAPYAVPQPPAAGPAAGPGQPPPPLYGWSAPPQQSAAYQPQAFAPGPQPAFAPAQPAFGPAQQPQRPLPPLPARAAAPQQQRDAQGNLWEFDAQTGKWEEIEEDDFQTRAVRITATAAVVTVGAALLLQATGMGSQAKSAMTGVTSGAVGLLVRDNHPDIAAGLLVAGAVNVLQAIFGS